MLYMISALRQQINANQKSILGSIWQYYIQNLSGMPVASIPKICGLSDEVVSKSIKDLNGCIIYAVTDTNGKKRYHLTYLGYLLTDQGFAKEQLAVDYLRYVQNQLLSNPELSTIKSQDVESALGWSKEFSQMFIKPLLLSPFANGGTHSGTEWTVNLPGNLDDIQLADDISDYLFARVLADYDPAMPIDRLEQSDYLKNKQEKSPTKRPQSAKARDAIRAIDSHGGVAPASIDTTQKEGAIVSNLDVFISHSSKDKDVADSLIELLRAAMNIVPEKIRCTSLDGYRLAAGASAANQIREEILRSSILIGLMTKSGVSSAYVLFELGAAWGAQRTIIPLLARGANSKLLSGPLADYNALSCDKPAQLQQLVGEIAKTLNLTLNSPSVYQKHLDSLVSRSRAVRLTAKRRKEKRKPSVEKRRTRRKKKTMFQAILPLPEPSLPPPLAPTTPPKTNSELLYQIPFNYADSPTQHGWRVGVDADASQPTFRRIVDGIVGEAIEIQPNGGYDMSCIVPVLAHVPTLLEFIAKYDSKSVVYAGVIVESRDGSKTLDSWLTILQGSGQSKPVNDETLEWEVFYRPVRYEGDWAVFQIDLQGAVKSSFGIGGWVLKGLHGFRIRGHTAIAKISLFR